MVGFAEAGNIASLMEQLPEMLFLSDLAFYVFGVLFFGSIAMKGFRGYMHFLPHFGARILMGLLSMLGGIALRGFLPSLSQGFYQLFRTDIIAGSLISSLVLLAGMYLVSFRMINVPALNNRIKDIRRRIEKSEGVPKRLLGWRDPLKIAGSVVLVGFAAFSLMGFSGFPLISESFLAFIGLSASDLESISEQVGRLQEIEEEVPEGCESVITLLAAAGDLDDLPISTDTGAMGRIEEGSGSGVVVMWFMTYGGMGYYVAQTESSEICSASSENFCGCIDPAEFTY